LTYNAVLAFTWAFVISVFTVPSVIQLALKKRILDKPNNRTVHVNLTPRLGGLGIFAGLISSLTIFGDFSDKTAGLQYLLAGTTLVFFIGLKDDILPVSAFKKFFVQMMAAGIVLIIGDIRIKSFHGLLGIHEIDHSVSLALTFFVIVGLTNAINLIDGLDGLAGVLVVIICVSFGLFFITANSCYTVPALALAGGMMGFLRYNITKAKIFMGDTGSLVSGFLVSIMAIKLINQQNLEHSPAIALSILIIPIVDTLRVMIIRVLNGVSPFSPDKNHLHHLLLKGGFRPLNVVVFLGFSNLLCILMVEMMKTTLEIKLLAVILFGFTLSGIVFLISKRKKSSEIQ